MCGDETVGDSGGVQKPWNSARAQMSNCGIETVGVDAFTQEVQLPTKSNVLLATHALNRFGTNVQLSFS